MAGEALGADDVRWFVDQERALEQPSIGDLCPNCRKAGSARAQLLNHRVRCKHCSFAFRATPIDDGVAANGAEGREEELRSLRDQLDRATGLLHLRESDLAAMALERDRAEARNLDLLERIQALEKEEPASLAVAPLSALGFDPRSIELDRKRAVDEAVEGAWADFERRLAEVHSKLKAAQARADLMESEAREARALVAAQERGHDLGEARSTANPQDLEARPSLADLEARLALASRVAVDRMDKPLADRIGLVAEQVRADLTARNDSLAESLVRGAEIEAGLDPGGFSIAGLRIFRPSPTIVAGLAALAADFDRVMRQGELESIRSTIEELKAVLGDQAGLPEIRRVGRTPTVKRPIAGDEALRLFVAAIESENWLIRPIAAGKPLSDTALTTYARLVEACVDARAAALEHQPARVEFLDDVTRACGLMLARRQHPDGHFSFLDPRGKPSKLAEVVEGMVASRPDAVQDGWVVHVDPYGMAQLETAACAVALLEAGRVLGRADWTQAAHRAADWAMDQPCLPNFLANAASIGLLAHAYLDAKEERHLVGLARKLAVGLLPGQVEDGRWVDPVSATTLHHASILKALHDAWEALPTDREELRGDLRLAITRGMASLLDESEALGVPSRGQALRALLRHRDLWAGLGLDPRASPAILDSATVIQELCDDGPRTRMGVAPEQLATLTRLA